MSNSKNWIVVLAMGLALGGCGWLKPSASKQYETSGETRPLEVPPDLDMPQTQSALSVPDRSEIATAPVVSDAPSSIPELVIADTLEGAMRRVALAIERSGAGRVVERNDAASSLSVELPAETATGSDSLAVVVKLESVEAERTRVRVTDAAGNAVDDVRARRLIEMLRQRLG